MKTAKLTSPLKYHSPLRESQTQATRERITQAAVEFFNKTGGQEELTYKAVAKEAGVTEMTVYRHFPKREDLMQALWTTVNSRIGVKMPETLAALIEGNQRLFQGFENLGPLMRASIMSKQGREIRVSLNSKREKAFLSVVDEINPKLSRKKKRQIEAVLSLLQSSYTWDSMRTYWDLNPKEIAEAVRLTIDSLIKTAKQQENL